MHLKTIVVGGGIAGIASALILAERGYEVHLIEREAQIGGLLKSRSFSENWFDYGTHLLREIGEPELDGLLFGAADFSEKYVYLDYPKVGNYFKGLNEKNAWVDLNVLPAEESKLAIKELLETEESNEDYPNLEAQLKGVFGNTTAEKVMMPALEKFFNEPIANLALNSNLLFGLSRISLLDDAQTEELKKDNVLDRKIGFRSFSQGISGLRSFYPKQDGIGHWSASMSSKLKDLGVHIHSSTAIDKIESKDGTIHSMKLDDGSVLECDFVYWTIAPFFLLKLGQIQTPESKAPKLIQVALHNYVIDAAYATKLHYLHVYDPDFSPFRITLYKNINPENKDYTLTVEVFVHEEVDLSQQSKTVFEELKQMNIIPVDANILSVESFIEKNGFPIPTMALNETTKTHRDLVKQNFKNCVLLGKASGKAFFMNEVFLNVHSELKKSNVSTEYFI